MLVHQVELHALGSRAGDVAKPHSPHVCVVDGRAGRVAEAQAYDHQLVIPVYLLIVVACSATSAMAVALGLQVSRV